MQVAEFSKKVLRSLRRRYPDGKCGISIAMVKPLTKTSWLILTTCHPLVQGSQQDPDPSKPQCRRVSAQQGSFVRGKEAGVSSKTFFQDSEAFSSSECGILIKNDGLGLRLF